MKKLITWVMFAATLTIYACKNDSAEQSGITFTTSVSKPFSINLTIVSDDGRTIYWSDIKDNLNTSFSYNQASVVKNRRVRFYVLTTAGTDIDAELKIKGKVYPPNTDSRYAFQFDGKSVKGWDYLIP